MEKNFECDFCWFLYAHLLFVDLNLAVQTNNMNSYQYMSLKKKTNFTRQDMTDPDLEQKDYYFSL